MGMKVYAVYSIPKSPEYRLEGLFATKDGAKDYIRSRKEDHNIKMCEERCASGSWTIEEHIKKFPCIIYDIQIEEVKG